MKFDAAWVNRSAQCHDGAAWGLEYVKDGAKGIPEALEGFERADWLLWYMVKAEVLSIEMAFDFCLEAASERLVSEYVIAEIKGIIDASYVELKSQRTVTGKEAERYMTSGDFNLGHEYSVACFLYRMKARMHEGDIDEALKDGQCVINNLVAAQTGSLNFERPAAQRIHLALCHWLKSRVVVKQ